ncbi:MAG: GNAT family N-acetyltransferase [Clostridia bacterium]|nr:GNAT family N-acetyltransferase [Clostridia bacterium]MBQ8369018.1 GNAT family N-acetyltransferase [Clostridia bacterium]
MHPIVYLPPEQYKGHVIPIRYTTETYYEVSASPSPNGFDVTFELARFPSPVTHYPEEYDFPDSLYQDHWDNAEAYGIVVDGKLLAAIEVWLEEWSHRLRVTELWVSDELQGKGYGHALMEKAKEIARRRDCRAVMLETQSCNTNAIGFYLHEGFTLIGFDLCCYSNRDTERKEVRVELGYFLK